MRCCIDEELDRARKNFQDIQIPCSHAIRAICDLKQSRINDYIHESYFVSTYKAMYEAFLMPIEMEGLSEDSDCEACGISSRKGRISKKRKHSNLSRPSKRSNSCS